MDPQDRLHCIFGYETHGGRRSVLWENPSYFSRPGGQGGKMLDEAYDEWRRSKRKFTEDEVVKGEWLKEGDHGHSFRVTFYEGGRLKERSFDDTGDSWEGSWTLQGGVLRTRIGPYELDIFANREGNVHSGIEIKNDRPNAYFRLTHVK